MIERFLTTATILQSILDNPDNFIKKWELTVYDLRPQILQEFLVKLLVNLQDAINFEKTVEILVANKMTEFLMAHLRDETELSMSDLLDEGHAVEKSGSARDKQWTFGFKDGVRYFSKYPR